MKKEQEEPSDKVKDLAIPRDCVLKDHQLLNN